MDLDPIYNPSIDPRYAKIKYLNPKVIPTSLEDINKKPEKKVPGYKDTVQSIEKRLESLEKRLEYLIQLMEQKN